MRDGNKSNPLTARGVFLRDSSLSFFDLVSL